MTVIAIRQEEHRFGDRRVTADSKKRISENVADIDNARLVALIQQGHAQAESEMVKRFARGVQIMLARKCNPDVAEDVAQETWRVTIEKVRNGDLRQPDRLPAFIHQIARNQIIMYFRKYSEVQEMPGENDLESNLQSPEQNYEAQQLSDQVRELINRLDTPRDREILMRFYVNEEDKDVICSDLGLTSQHFNRVIYRAKTRIRTYLSNELQELSNSTSQ
jgi:RNA polymerase sigma-70 factor (ECF subfamily)